MQTLGHLAKTVLFAFTILISFCLSAQEPVQVTILGTHHFANPGADQFNIQQDDVKSEKRQKEVEDLASRLIRFKPTKVLIEAPYGSSRSVVRYKEFLDHLNLDSLSRNESEQLGFRIAAHFGHETVYPFDYRMNLDFSELDSLAREQPEVGQRFQRMMGEIGATVESIDERLKKETLVEFLRFMNQTEQINANHGLYLRMLNLGGENSWGATKGVANWYERNIRMFYNVNRIADFSAPDERLLIIVGQGHVKIIKDLIEDSPYYEYIDVLSFLE